MTLRVTGNVTNGQQMHDAINRHGRRSIAQTLRRQGDRAVQSAEHLASVFLHPRSGSRHREGAHYHTSFKAVYTGLDVLEGDGSMSVALTNNSPAAWIIEKGSVGHFISPGDPDEGRLAWPKNPPHIDEGGKYRVLPIGVSVDHPGTRAYGIMEQSIRHAVAEGINNKIVGRAHVRFSFVS